MSGSLVVLLSALSLSALHYDIYGEDNTTYHVFPRFWTSTGLCPPGDVTHENVKEFLRSDSMQINILYLSALPAKSLTHIRIHWMLELLKFVQYSQSGLPIYDFSDLDDFLEELNTMNLYPMIEFMGNISDVFVKNPTYNNVLWEDLSYEVTKHYLNTFGAKTVLKWRFETWNEPDLHIYNKLNFSLPDYITYTKSIQHGMQRASIRTPNKLYFPLRGPAGLFKAQQHHMLCWGILDFCSTNITECPFDILTFHGKGNGTASAVLSKSKLILSKIYKNYPQLKKFPISNDEADPVSGWSTPREFQEDVRYAKTLIEIVMQYWSAKLKSGTLSQLESISHDNAFLSYHPYEFSQRTLLAHFRMNNTNPPHSQFIQKPVYAALGLLSRMADLASDVMEINTLNGYKLEMIKSTGEKEKPLYKSWLILPTDECECNVDDDIQVIDQNRTNPALIWRQFNRPSFPSPTIREEMRRYQTLYMHDIGILKTSEISIDFSSLSYPWVMLVRFCSNLNGQPYKPEKIQITGITQGEVLVSWQETNPSPCLKTFEIWFRSNGHADWIHISREWHLPFNSFQYAPGQNVNGFYKVRSVDVFNRTSSFSAQVQYIEI
ncbi:alpha-L-iduronidase isoform X2 [Stomoxys calcitrans]|uniref:Fibronectin type-III domain-containing protein n=1 Tax=Stomoxys calcitrans TaxID=35570 RepID=A0A1I8PKQ4_STOCA|nr:alpha-L-iduronidase isoform X2 [Stomoxys calcitrans]